MKENEIIGYLVKFFERNGWDVYKIAMEKEKGPDLIFRKGNELFVIEVKGSQENAR